MYQAVDSKLQQGKGGGSGPSRGGRRRRPEKTGGSWSWFFFKVILFFGLVGGSYVGYTMYRASKKNSLF
jgi:lectin, mannose-binding 2